MLSLPGLDVVRAYSLTGHDGRDVLSIAVKRRTSDGAGFAGDAVHLSDHGHRLAVGDGVRIEVPKGIFTPPLRGRRPLIFLAAGIGITPFIGQLEALARLEPAERVARVLLLYGCRNGGEHAFAGRLRELSGLLPELDLFTRIPHRAHKIVVLGITTTRGGWSCRRSTLCCHKGPSPISAVRRTSRHR